MTSDKLYSFLTVSVALLGIWGCAKKPIIQPLQPRVMQGMGANPRIVRIGYMKSIGHAPAILGFADGTFSHAFGDAVVVQAVTYDNQITAMKDMFDRQIDIMFMDPSAAYSGYLQSHGNSFKLVSGVSTSTIGLVVSKSRGSFDVKSLANARIGVPSHGGIEEVKLRKVLASQ